MAFAACTPKQQNENSIKIMVELRPEINYVTHLYALAGLGFSDDEYTARYGNTTPRAAIDTLQKYKDFLIFGQGEGGMLAGPFFFTVSQLDISNRDSMQKVMNTIKKEGQERQISDKMMKAVDAIAKVFVDNYETYLQQTWPKVKADMEDRVRLLNQHLQGNSFARDWEQVTGYQWKRGDYHWLLFRAGENGPSYNNLSENTNTVYYNQSVDLQLSMFSHEFGIFLMQDEINPIYQEMRAYVETIESEEDLTYVPWSAFESLSCWYNCQIAGEETEDYRNFTDADVDIFCKIYDELSRKGITNPAELYRKGIEEYLSIKVCQES